MSLFRIYVDGALFYHPQMSKLAITEAKVHEDAENIDCLTLSAPHNHPYIDSIRPMSTTIILKKRKFDSFRGKSLGRRVGFLQHPYMEVRVGSGLSEG